jgi:iron complex outermembrane recepter protein
MHRFTPLVSVMLLAGLGAHMEEAMAQAQSTANANAAQLERITVTGSRIKRLSDERAQPMQTFGRGELDRQGIETAEELLSLIGANASGMENAVSANNIFGPEADKLAGGAAFANLRGLGPNGTLVLLNGRRVSTHGTSGGAVDLNAIPMDAVERVEVLKDGASAIYGTDAIGGVINYILKKNFSGAQLRASMSDPFSKGGGTQRRVALTAGLGNLKQNGFNLMGSLTVDDNDILRGIDRPWASGYQLERGLSPETTSAPHANVIGSGTNTTLLNSGGTRVGATDTTRYTNINLLGIRGECDKVPFGTNWAPAIPLWDQFGYTQANSRYRCGTDYGRMYMLQSPKNAYNLMARAAVQLNDDHLLSFEFVTSRTKSLNEFTPTQFSTTVNPVTHYPVNGIYYQPIVNALVAAGAQDLNVGRPIAYRLRHSDWGYRTQQNISDNLRANVTLEGNVGKYDYNLGLTMGEATGSLVLVDGYSFIGKYHDALRTGIINPFLLPGQEQTAEAKALIESTKARGRIHGGTTKVVQFDASLSGEFLSLPGGPIGFAVGTDLRRETYEFSGTQTFACFDTLNATNAANPNAVGFCPGNSSAPNTSRDIRAVYGELRLPLLKNLEMQLAVRHDRYSVIGGTTNPKIAVKFTPTNWLFMRASANTGFRAPTAQQLNLGTMDNTLTGSFRDPVLCADINAPQDATQCNRQSLPWKGGGNPSLKPEESKQASFGIALEPIKGLQLLADVWQVKMDDRIKLLNPNTMIANYDVFKDYFFRETGTQRVNYIQAGWVNAATSESKGLDLGARYSMPALGGRVDMRLDVSKMISHKEQDIATAPVRQLVGEWTTTTLYLPWRGSGALEYIAPTWSTTLSFIYRDSYLDENRAPYMNVDPPRRTIDAYTTFGLSASYRGFKGWTLRGGISNLFDKEPPFTYHNVDNVVGAGWDPRVADPRGRSWSLSVGYKF